MMPKESEKETAYESAPPPPESGEVLDAAAQETQERLKADAEDPEEGKEYGIKIELEEARQRHDFENVSEEAFAAGDNRLEILTERRDELEAEMKAAKGLDKMKLWNEIQRLNRYIDRAREIAGTDEADREEKIVEQVDAGRERVDDLFTGHETALRELLEAGAQDLEAIERSIHEIPQLLNERDVYHPWEKQRVDFDDFTIWKRVKAYFALASEIQAEVLSGYTGLKEQSSQLYERLETDYSGRSVPLYLEQSMQFEVNRRVEEHVWQRYDAFWRQTDKLWRDMEIDWRQRVEELRGVWGDSDTDAMLKTIDTFTEQTDDIAVVAEEKENPVAEEMPAAVAETEVREESQPEHTDIKETLVEAQAAEQAEQSETVVPVEQTVAIAEEQHAEIGVEEDSRESSMLEAAQLAVAEVSNLREFAALDEQALNEKLSEQVNIIKDMIDSDYLLHEQDLVELLECEEFDFRQYLEEGMNLEGFIEEQVEPKILEWVSRL
ncbi:MAG TPA: hypothetical protein PKL83_05205, partial [bacterium]|nr:hypothetical protein [bacterium]